LDAVPTGVWLFRGFVNDAEKRLWIEVGMLFEKPERLVGGVVPMPGEEGVAEWGEGDTIGLRSGLLELERTVDPLKAIGEVARPRDLDMERCLGIEIDNGAVFVDDAAAGLSEPARDEVDLDR
jgi:hypothetical protein